MQIETFIGEYERSFNNILFIRFTEVPPNPVAFVEDLSIIHRESIQISQSVRIKSIKIRSSECICRCNYALSTV